MHKNVSFLPPHLIVEQGIEFQVDSHFLVDRAVIDQCLPEPRIPGKKCDALLILDPLYMSQSPSGGLAIVFIPEVKFHSDMS